jgi:hypothetical protein
MAGAGSSDLYVDNAAGAGCSDSGSGAPSEPFCTITAAAAAAQPGDTVVVEPGNYGGLTISVSGTPAAPITFLAADGPSGSFASLDGGVTLSGVHDVVVSGFIILDSVVIDNSSDITINGGMVEGAVAATAIILATGTSSNVTISRVSVNGQHTPAVEIDQGVTGAIVTTNTIIGDHGLGPALVVNSAPGTDVVSNTIYSLCRVGVNVTGASPGTVLENNIVEAGSSPFPSALCADPGDAIGISVSAASVPQTIADYNLIDPGSGGPLYSWAGTSYTSLTAFTAATGQGTHDIAASPGLGPNYPGFFCWPLDATSPAIDSADANAPGELATDELNNPRADDPSVPNTGTGDGYYDRGAVELEGSVGPGPLTVQPDPTEGPLAVTVSAPETSSWPTNGPIGILEVTFGDLNLPVITNSTNIDHIFASAGGYSVDVVQGIGDFEEPGPQPHQTASVVVGADYTPVTPTRILDTRIGLGAAEGAIASHADMTLPVPATGGVSAADMSGIAVNVTVTGPTAAGSLTVFTQAGHGDATSNIDFVRGQTLANLVTIQPSGGAITFQNNSSGTVQVVADLEGYYSNAGSGFQTAGPARVLDTRSKIGTTAPGPVPAGGTVKLNLSGKVPAGATAAVLNLTVTQPTSAGFITAYPDGQPVPDTSNLNFVAGQTVPNQVIVPLTNDVADFYNHSSGTVQLVADLGGYYAPGAPGSFVPYGPIRIADTRTSSGPVPSRATMGIYPDTIDFTPLSAFVLNVTVTQPQAAGFLTAYPYGGSLPDSSNVNFTAGETVANLVTVAPAAGEVGIYNHSPGTVQVVIDEEGYFIDQQ